MTDEPANTADTPAPQSYPVVADAVLVSLVRVAYTGGIELGLTLLIGGRKVGGTLVSPSKWMGDIADTVAGGSDDDVLAGVFREVAVEFANQEAEAKAKLERREDDEDEDELLHFIHLLDAGMDGELGERRPWRVRIADVQGWTIGVAKLG